MTDFFILTRRGSDKLLGEYWQVTITWSDEMGQECRFGSGRISEELLPEKHYFKSVLEAVMEQV